MKEIKLHVCAGDVYLKGFINIDIKGKLATEIKNNPNKTTIDKYYKYDFRKSKPREFIIDKLMNILEKWDYDNKTVQEIIMISAIEHFTRTEAEFIMSEIKRVLRPEGQLIIDFPNIKKDIELYYYKDPEFMMELLYCNHKDRLSTHNWGYTQETFLKLLGDGWKEIVWGDWVEHAYPMVGALCIKQ